jgi:ATP-dependent Lon protease
MTDHHPAFATLLQPTWDQAFRALLERSHPSIGAGAADDLRALVGDRALITEEIPELIESLYARGTVDAGELALAWSMLTCSPSRPATFRAVLPQLQATLDHAELDSDTDADLRDRLRIWWRAARGDFAEQSQKLSMHSLAETTLKAGALMDQAADLPSPPSLDEALSAQWFAAPYPGPTMVVMPKARATKLNTYNKPFEAILGKPLPLVVARGLADAQKRLSYEFPHATTAFSLLFRDLREGEPARVRPTILVGPPGAGKSRFVRRFSASVGWQHVQRYDGATSSDGHFAGTSKGWSNTEASVPARAVLMSRTANPIVFIDEIDKAATSNHLGSLNTSLLAFLESETAATYRDQSTDCEFDFSAISFICTANDVSKLPDHLRDRFRILKVPAPRLVDLPLLAARVMEDLAAEDAERA